MSLKSLSLIFLEFHVWCAIPVLCEASFIKILQDTIHDRMEYRMKVTVLLPDQLIEEVKAHAKGQTLTESLTLALEEWLRLKKISHLNEQVRQHPLEFSKRFSALRTRTLNRRL